MEPRYADSGEFQLSNSSLETALRCFTLYWKRRNARRRIVTVPMAIGTAVAEAARVDLEAKRLGLHQDLRYLLDVAAEKYAVEVEENEVQNAAKFDVQQSKDSAVQATVQYVREISPGIVQPLLVEEAIMADLGDGLHLVGRPDVIEPNLVRDLKTGQPWDQRRADRSRQLTTYDILYEAKFGESPARVAIDSLSRPTKGRLWGAKTIWSSRCERDRLALVKSAQWVRKAIEDGTELPAAEGAWWCSPGHCEEWTTCEVRPGA